MKFKVGDKVKYFYSFPSDECEIRSMDFLTGRYGVRRYIADGTTHDFEADESDLTLVEEAEVPPIINDLFKDTEPKECIHDWYEVIGSFRSLGWSCRKCDKKKEEWETEQQANLKKERDKFWSGGSDDDFGSARSFDFKLD